MATTRPEKSLPQDVIDPRCRVEMLGGLCLVRTGGQVTRFARQKSGLLLAFLALSPGPQSREKLLDLFWPEMDLPAGRDNLSTALASLRRQIEPAGVRKGSVLAATHTQVGLNPDAVTTDVADFERLLDRSQFAEAVALYRGGFLPGCYQDWAVREADRLEARFTAALVALAQEQEARGALTDALETTRRQAEADPYSEEAHHRLIRLSVLCGHPKAARDAWTRFEQMLTQEFGTTPSAETRRQVEALLAGSFRFASPSGTHSPVPVTGPVAAAPAASVRAGTPRAPAAPPVVLSRFFGREPEISRLLGLLLPKDWTEGPEGPEPACRLVTLTGLGGIGKTRLAVELARQFSERLPAWCGFVGLAEVTTPAQIPARIASALGLPPSSEMTALDQVGAFFAAQDGLGAGPSVLVLDNLEHLLRQDEAEEKPGEGDDAGGSDGAAWVRSLLELAPGLSVLCTSRRRLGLRGEQVVPVLSLPVPLADEGADLTLLARSPSVRLYLDRAQAVRPDFALTPANAPAVAALCRQLEGSPLALELAAAWVRTLPPRKMWERLTAGLEMPLGGYGDLPARHSSLSAALEWSWRLMPPAQQRLWARLSVFRGGWTAETAAEACAEPDADVLLARLAEASVVTLQETDAGEVRYDFLETVRAFGASRLEEERDGGTAEAAARHAVVFRALAEAAEPELRGPAQREWLDRLDAEHDNLRAVLTRHLAGTGDADTEAATHLSVLLSRFWNVRGHWEEGQQWLTAGLARPSAAHLPPVLRARALNIIAGFARLQGDLPRAQTLFEESLALRRQIGDQARIADTLHNLGYLTLERGDLVRAQALYEESLTICRDLGDRIGIADELHHLGLAAQEGNDPVRAEAFYKESLAIRRSLGDERGLSYTLHNLGNIAQNRGDWSRAKSLHEESLAIRRSLGDKQGIAGSLHSLGRLCLHQHDDATAGELFAEGLSLSLQLGDKSGVVAVLEGLAAQALSGGRPERAGRLYGAASALRDALSLPLSPASKQTHEEILTAAARSPQAAVFTLGWSHGQTLTLHQAAELAAER